MMDSFHAIEAQMFRWRRRADGLYEVLIHVLRNADGTVPLSDEQQDMIEQYCLDRFDHMYRWRKDLNIGKETIK